VLHDCVQPCDLVQGQVTRPSESAIHSFSKFISFAIYDGSWQVISETRRQYLIWSGPMFDIWPSFCVM